MAKISSGLRDVPDIDAIGETPAREYLCQSSEAEHIQTFDRSRLNDGSNTVLRRQQDLRDYLDPMPPVVTQSCNDGVHTT